MASALDVIMQSAIIKATLLNRMVSLTNAAAQYDCSWEKASSGKFWTADTYKDSLVSIGSGAAGSSTGLVTVTSDAFSAIAKDWSDRQVRPACLLALHGSGRCESTPAAVSIGTAMAHKQ